MNAKIELGMKFHSIEPIPVYEPSRGKVDIRDVKGIVINIDQDVTIKDIDKSFVISKGHFLSKNGEKNETTLQLDNLSNLLENPQIIDLLVICHEETKKNPTNTFQQTKEGVKKYFEKTTLELGSTSIVDKIEEVKGTAKSKEDPFFQGWEKVIKQIEL